MSEHSEDLEKEHSHELEEAVVSCRSDDAGVYPLRTAEDRGWEEFRDQCRRQMKRPMELRIKYGFCRMYKPVLDDAPWRVFNTTSEYRDWCASRLPDYLGYKPTR